MGDGEGAAIALHRSTLGGVLGGLYDRPRVSKNESPIREVGCIRGLAVLLPIHHRSSEEKGSCLALDSYSWVFWETYSEKNVMSKGDIHPKTIDMERR